MFDQIKNLLGLGDDTAAEKPSFEDTKLAAAALMVHVIAADGKIDPQEEEKLRAVLRDHYAVSAQEADFLEKSARKAQSEAVDLYGFTSVLKSQMSHEERLALVEDLWEMVYADGTVHEFEDNVVWRVAELIGISGRERMILKGRVKDRLSQSSEQEE